MGIARLGLAALAVLALVALVVIGVRSLSGALSVAAPKPTPTDAPPSPAPFSASPQRVPTVAVRCVRKRCPTVFLRVAGGDVLINREMDDGEQVRSFEKRLDVVLADSASVRVLVNGEERPPGSPGKRQEFTVSRD
ncbi:hypothetical protein ACFQ08_21320 [Streptosporangium algeriense]|uniref:DUF4115 domain-containing protein n=1 Tax=Streptosporangium algeriense TaxID=1682748 RepID=A0ABW3DTC0_9ACTN